MKAALRATVVLQAIAELSPDFYLLHFLSFKHSILFFVTLLETGFRK